MSTLSLIALAVALAAIVGLAFQMSDQWFCALLALACLLGGADSAYRGLRLWALLLLLAGALFAGAAIHAAYSAGQQERHR